MNIHGEGVLEQSDLLRVNYYWIDTDLLWYAVEFYAGGNVFYVRKDMSLIVCSHFGFTKRTPEKKTGDAFLVPYD